MKDLSLEFSLLAACCHWPRTPASLHAIRRASAEKVDWALLRDLVAYHRVASLVQDGLVAAQCTPPDEDAQAIKIMAMQNAHLSLLLAQESVRVQDLCAQAGISALFLKGAVLGQLAYGSLGLKHSRDVDVFVSQDDAATLIDVMQANGYVYTEKYKRLSRKRLQYLIGHYKEVPLVHSERKLLVEILWRPVLNSALCRGLTVQSPSQSVPLPAGGSLRTLQNDEHLVYLAMHGAMHRWARLKWLADFHALLMQIPSSNMARIQDLAKERGSINCLQQAYDLCEDVFASTALHVTTPRKRHTRRYLLENAKRHLFEADPQILRSSGLRQSSSLQLYYWRLGSGWRFLCKQASIAMSNESDIASIPLPERLLWLYPVLRVPLYIMRRLIKLWRKR